MLSEQIKTLLEDRIPGSILGVVENTVPEMLQIDSRALVDVCKLLHDNEQTYFDSLSCITGIDNGEEINQMEVIYHLYSIPFDMHLALNVQVDRREPFIDSVTTVWRTAEWHEREAYDLLGISFNGHPDLRRILLPDDWVGFPLRKDYVEQEKYHELKVKY